MYNFTVSFYNTDLMYGTPILPISVIKIRYPSLKRSHLVNRIIQDVSVARDIPCNSINHSIPSGKGWLRSSSKRIDSASEQLFPIGVSFPLNNRDSCRRTRSFVRPVSTTEYISAWHDRVMSRDTRASRKWRCGASDDSLSLSRALSSSLCTDSVHRVPPLFHALVRRHTLSA